MINVKQRGNFNRLKQFLQTRSSSALREILDKYGAKGVELLREATPKYTGLTADSWYYKIEEEHGRTVISWYNNNVQNGVNVALLVIYGHGTKNGGYVAANNFVKPIMGPLIKEMTKEVWKEA